MQSDWILPFFDLCTNDVSRMRVQGGTRTMWYEYGEGGMVVVSGLGVNGRGWGVEVSIGGTAKVAGVQWGAAGVVLGQMKAMADFCSVSWTMPGQDGSQQPQTAQMYHRSVVAMQGGKLCLRQGLITHLLTATYGNPTTGFVDVMSLILPNVRQGGVKGLEVTDHSMSYHMNHFTDPEDPATGNKLHITFLSDTPARPPPKAASRPRRSTIDSSSTCSNLSVGFDTYNQ
eukprot:TRINITY_DN623_c5_g1_i1.p1 TRINITY_DN623_c5_g1~~TRINITY_DN623_c5_g1_i1.p1  ORF type:complete len:246 (+),score=33.98 TRINITY_DN623_c5_g1_i1:54-740(+)